MSTLFANRVSASPDFLADLFGEPRNEEGVRKAIASVMYAEVRLGGGSHAAAYAMLVDEAGVDLADYAAVWGGNIEWRETPASQDPRLYGESYAEFALREAGIYA